MMECKKALTEANGDLDKAEEILRVRLGSKASKAASRVTAEGVVAISIEGQQAPFWSSTAKPIRGQNDDFLAFASNVAAMARSGQARRPGRSVWSVPGRWHGRVRQNSTGGQDW